MCSSQGLLIDITPRRTYLIWWDGPFKKSRNYGPNTYFLQTNRYPPLFLHLTWVLGHYFLSYFMHFLHTCFMLRKLDTVMSCPLLRLMYGEYWFRLSRLSMMVIGSFASYTKTKSVESAVWCLLTLDDDVETGNRQQDRNTWTRFRIGIVLFSFEQQQAKFNENGNKINNRTTNKINERLIKNNK